MDYTSTFDRTIARIGTSSEKWDALRKHFGTDDVIPLWVADMDFAAPLPVQEAIQQRMEHGVLGYTVRTNQYHQSIVNWMERRHQWSIDQDWIVFTPGVVSALNFAVETYTEPGDKVIIQTPVYPPFYSVVKGHGRELVENPLIQDSNGDYLMDFEHLESVLDEHVKMLILCNPHNPIGRVWTRNELEQLERLCAKWNIIVVSDEIHGDLVHEPHSHIPYASLSESARNRSIICTAPSKTFNIAGLNTSNIIIPNEQLRNAFALKINQFGIGQINVFGAVATEAAYTHGQEWLQQCMEYTYRNMEYVQQYIAEHLPELSVRLPEATYLLWIDCSQLQMEQLELVSFLLDQAKIALNDGNAFGTTGQGYMRMNVACSRSLLEEAMGRLHNAIKVWRTTQPVTATVE
ncbi:PatB family C-S lyase [Paenibacillus kyungheensis]|uniref:cysteine-S-conjugate beta-lyase n=1 Tax=Paenibacillus kyungheensis TaxID=1452732 RepID=A0AAX3LYN5_9BACL|nr:PatB family C-S lyase [Paenibacillus kyungheensis]WCT54957.1 PatB family C-S lyase [Paenibacillus kyungheensis]